MSRPTTCLRWAYAEGWGLSTAQELAQQAQQEVQRAHKRAAQLTPKVQVGVNPDEFTDLERA